MFDTGPVPRSSPAVVAPERPAPTRQLRGAPDPDPGRVDPDERRDRRLVPRVVQASSWWRWIFPALLTVVGLVAYGLFRSGTNLVLDSTEGSAVETVADATAPGYRALVTPTSTLAVYFTSRASGQDELVGVSVLSLDAVGGGAVVVLPPNLVFLPQPDDTEAVSLEAAFDPADPGPVTDALGQLFGTRFTDGGVVVDEDTLAALVDPITPLRIDLADPLQVEQPDGSVDTILGPGRHDLDAEEVVAVNGASNPGEVGENRSLRQQDLWEAWIDALTNAPDVDAVLPPFSEGLPAYLRGFAAGAPRVQFLQTSPFQASGSDDLPVYVLSPDDREALESLAAAIVPLPVDPGGGIRVPVELLAGTPDRAARDAAVPILVAAGAEIAVIGNADSLDVATTRVEYHDERFATAAAQMAEALGADPPTLVERLEPLTAITVVIGADA